jgi:glycerol kinase
VRAALESVCYQTRDLLTAMAQDAVAPVELRVDGGMVVNNWLTQSLADILQVGVVRPQTVETTALGAAFLAGLQAGVYDSLSDISRLWQADRRFKPKLAKARAEAQYRGWQDAVRRVRTA